MGRSSVTKACPYFICPSVLFIHPIKPIPPIIPIIILIFYSPKPQELTKGFVKAIVLRCKSYQITL